MVNNFVKEETKIYEDVVLVSQHTLPQSSQADVINNKENDAKSPRSNKHSKQSVIVPEGEKTVCLKINEPQKWHLIPMANFLDHMLKCTTPLLTLKEMVTMYYHNQPSSV